jgi:DNA-binding MarR family transcriptional regulator
MDSSSFFKIAIDKINKKWNKSVEKVTSTYHISRGELITLATIHKFGNNITLKELVAKLCFDKSHISRNVNSLMLKGYLNKVLKDGFKTKYGLVLTNEGIKVVAESKHLKDATKNELLSKLTKEELAIFRDLLLKLISE